MWRWARQGAERYGDEENLKPRNSGSGGYEAEADVF
jgi:hypothetical protein